MKRIGGIIAALAIASSLVVITPDKAVAEACANVSSFGAVILAVPTLPRSEEYVVWVRMQSPEDRARVLVEVNGDTCLEVGGSVTAGQWSWQTARSAGQPIKLDLPNRTGNGVRIVGVQSGVKVDRMLFTRPDCTPADFGDNCATPIELTGSQTDDHVELLPPPSDKPVSGKVTLSSTPARVGASLESVSYSVQGRVLQTSKKAAPFDTTLAENGKYTVNITTTTRDGKVIREATVIEIKNQLNPLSPAIRWARLNQRSVLLVFGIVASVAALFLFGWAIRTWRIRYRMRKFHGF